MDLIAHQRTKTSIHQLVPCQWPHAFKFAGNHKRLEMSVIVTEDLDGCVVESGLDQAAYLEWIHANQVLRKAPGRAVYRESAGLPNALRRLCMIAGRNRAHI